MVTTAQTMAIEVKALVGAQYVRSKEILIENEDGHDKLAALLIEREVIFAEDMERIFGKRQWTSRADELMEENDTRSLTLPHGLKYSNFATISAFNS